MPNELFIGNPVDGYLIGSIVDDDYNAIVQAKTYAGRPGNGSSLRGATNDIKRMLCAKADEQGVEYPADLREWYEQI